MSAPGSSLRFVLPALLAALAALVALLWPAGSDEDAVGTQARVSPDAEPGAPLLTGSSGAPTRRPRAAGGAADVAAPGPTASEVSRRVEGRVLGPDGAPLVGARVTVVGSTEGLTTLTDADGRYTLEGAIPANAVLQIEAAGFATWTLQVGEGAAALVARLTAGRTASGVIVDAETGRGIPDVLLGARPTHDPTGGPWAMPTRSAADGVFVAELPGTGPWLLEIGSRSLPRAASPERDYVPITVAPVEEGARNLRITLRRGLVIEVALLADDGSPYAGDVWADLVGRNALGDPDYTRRRQVVSSGPRLRIPGLEEGRYDLHIIPNGDRTLASVPPPVRLRDIAAGALDLSVRLTLGTFLEGRVVDPQGELIATQGTLHVYREGQRGGHAEAFGKATGDGIFRCGPLERGVRYDVLGTAFPGRRPGWLAGVQPGDTRLDLVLLPAGAIRGRVLDAQDRPAPAGVPVAVLAIDMSVRDAGVLRTHAYTAADGTFTVDGLADVAFEVQPGGGNSAYLGASVPDVRPGTADLVLRVSPGVDLTGLLVNGRGEPVAATSLQGDDGSRRAAMRPYCQVGPDGRFTLRGLQPGRVRLGMMRAGAWVALGELDAPASDARVTVPDP